MSAVEWSLLYLALAFLFFVFVLTLCIAGAREDRQRERLYLERIRRQAERNAPPMMVDESIIGQIERQGRAR